MKSRKARRVRPTQPLDPSQQQLLSVEDKELATVRRSRPRRGCHCTNSILSNSIERLAGAMPNAAKEASVGPSLSHEHPCTGGRCGSCGHSLVWTAWVRTLWVPSLSLDHSCVSAVYSRFCGSMHLLAFQHRVGQVSVLGHSSRTLHFPRLYFFFLFGSWCCDDELLGVGVFAPSSRRVLCEYWIVLVSFSVCDRCSKLVVALLV